MNNLHFKNPPSILFSYHYFLEVKRRHWNQTVKQQQQRSKKHLILSFLAFLWSVLSKKHPPKHSNTDPTSPSPVHTPARWTSCSPSRVRCPAVTSRWRRRPRARGTSASHRWGWAPCAGPPRTPGRCVVIVVVWWLMRRVCYCCVVYGDDDVCVDK